MDDRIRAYDEALDLDAVVRTWLEVGWIDGAARAPGLRTLLAAGNVEVALMDDEAECMVHWTPGSIRYETSDLALCAVTAVTTSHIGRKQGFASTMTARAIAQGAEAGCAVAALGMFEQGFYDTLGFGTGSYDHRVSFDPASLMVDHVPYRPPSRITTDQWADMHDALTHRLRTHGSVVLDPPRIIEGELGLTDPPFALGYRDTEGRLTHYLMGDLGGERGPWHIQAIAYRTTDQLLELLRLLREMSDQIRSVQITEPAHVQLQVMLRNPIRERVRSAKSDHASYNRSIAWWQFRMLDVPACVAARHWLGEPVRFNLSLRDPAADRLDGAWRGVAGDYVVTIGAQSTAVPGRSEDLPQMSASVGAFTRLWFGVRPPTALVVSDDIEAPPALLAALDDALRLPKPVPGWSF